MKRVKIVRQNRAETEPKTFYLRHDRFFTLLGTFLIFATFIAKETISDNLKDLASSLEAAQNVFVLRHDELFKKNTQDNSGKLDTAFQRKKDIEYECNETLDLVEISGDLAEHVTDKEKFKSRTEAIRKEAWAVKNDLDEIDSRQGLSADLIKVSKRSAKAHRLAGQVQREIDEQATALREKRQMRYAIAKWASYFLFAVGWCLTFYGQLSGKKPEGSNI
jgi:hypothetical protein